MFRMLEDWLEDLTGMDSAYTGEQLSAFLDLINLPTRYRTANGPRDLELLTALHTHAITSIPYSNLGLHYASSENREPSLDPQDVYHKIVVDGRDRGIGGYCMEGNLIYLEMLRAMRFYAYAAGVRIRLRTDGVPHGDYLGPTHTVNIVVLENGTKWVSDVSFGGDGPTRPIPMRENCPAIPNLGHQEIRLVRDHIPQQQVRTPESRLWIYQYRNGVEKPWNSFYAFSEMEYVPADFIVSNLFAGPYGRGFQGNMTIVVKFLGRPNPRCLGGVEIYGKRMMVQGTVKENLGGKTVVVEECVSEAQRIQALRRWFDIRLTQVEQAGIRGWRTELKPSMTGRKA